MVCEPVPLKVFGTIEIIVIFIFTAEYLLRLFTCWAVPPRYVRKSDFLDVVRRLPTLTIHSIDTQ